MEPSQLNLLKDQYNDYFIIEHDIRINVKPFSDEEPDEHGFERLIPEPFLMAGEQVMLEQSALKSLKPAWRSGGRTGGLSAHSGTQN